jgi:uncharacterized protein (DUF39 family)
VSLVGYGVSLALGVGIPIPILNPQILRRTTVRDRDIYASVIDYSSDYPNRTGKVLCRLTYEDLRKGEVSIMGKKIEVGSLSSYPLALEVAGALRDEIKRGDFLLSKPYRKLPPSQSMKPLVIRERKK